MKTKMLSKKIGYWAGVIAIGTVLGLSLQFAKAWVDAPPVAPPGGNVGAPINTEANIQNKKEGTIGLQNLSATGVIRAGAVANTVTPGDVAGTRLCIGTDCKDAWPDAGTSQWVTAGNNIYNGNSGNVGIGTNNPQAKLQVNTTTIGGGEVRINASGNESGIGYYSSGDDWVAGVGGWGNTNKFLIGSINTSAGPKITIQTNGNVGIGTTSPSEKLEVNGNVKIGKGGSIFFPEGEIVGRDQTGGTVSIGGNECSQRGELKLFTAHEVLGHGTNNVYYDSLCVCLHHENAGINRNRWNCLTVGGNDYN